MTARGTRLRRILWIHEDDSASGTFCLLPNQRDQTGSGPHPRAIDLDSASGIKVTVHCATWQALWTHATKKTTPPYDQRRAASATSRCIRPTVVGRGGVAHILIASRNAGGYVVGTEKYGEVAADDVRLRVTKESFGAGIPTLDGSVKRDREYRVVTRSR